MAAIITLGFCSNNLAIQHDLKLGLDLVFLYLLYYGMCIAETSYICDDWMKEINRISH